MIIQKNYVALLLTALLLATAPDAWATATLRISDNAGNTSGDVAAPVGTPGQVNFFGTIGKWILNIETGVTKPAYGNANLPELELNFADGYMDSVGTPGGKVLTVMFSETDFTLANPAFFNALGGTLGLGLSLTYQAFLGKDNVLFSTGVNAVALGPVLGSDSTPFSAGALTPPVLNLAGPYSLTQVLTLTYTGGAISMTLAGGDATIYATPDRGGTLWLLAMAAIGLESVRRRCRVVAT